MRLGAVNCQLLDLIHEFTATVVASSGVALRILVRENRAARLADRSARIVFRCNELKMVFLALAFLTNPLVNSRVLLRKNLQSCQHLVYGISDEVDHFLVSFLRLLALPGERHAHHLLHGNREKKPN